MSHAFQSLFSPQTYIGSISSYLKLINFTRLHTVLELSFLSMPNKHKDKVAKIPYLDTTKMYSNQILITISYSNQFSTVIKRSACNIYCTVGYLQGEVVHLTIKLCKGLHPLSVVEDICIST